MDDGTLLVDDLGDPYDVTDQNLGIRPARVAALSYFFPAHNEEANLEGLVEEALATLPSLAETFEIIAVNDGSTDGTRDIADALAARYPDVVRAVHHPVNQGYGAALRSGFSASRFELIAFTDGDRQFKVADIGSTDRPPGGCRRARCRRGVPDQAGGSTDPDAVRPRLPTRQSALLRTQGDRRRLRRQAVPARGARRHPRRVRRSVLLRRAAHQAAGERPQRGGGRHPALPTHGRARRPARSHR